MEAAAGTGEGSHLLVTIEIVGVLPYSFESELMKSPSLILKSRN